ncbi:MAG: DUF167 domain-containing protein [Thermoleophilia bacterium]|nr:DUF167 domain-containing protein [Thermoleophilia bacterium]
MSRPFTCPAEKAPSSVASRKIPLPTWRSTRIPTNSSGRVLSSTPEGTLLKVRVSPGAKKSELAGKSAGRLRVRLAAPPVEGKANRELQRFLASVFGIRRNRLTLAAGERSRKKTVLMAGMPLDEARDRLRTALGEE